MAFDQIKIQARIVLMSQIILMFGVFLGPICIFSGLPVEWSICSWNNWIAGVLIGVGSVLSGPGVLSLGRSFTASAFPKKNAGLVLQWPYSWIRNPIYTGILTLSLGWALLFRSIPTLGVALVMLIVLRLKVSLEERLLREMYGQDYERYCRRVGRFLPRIGPIRHSTKT